MRDYISAGALGLVCVLGLMVLTIDRDQRLLRAVNYRLRQDLQSARRRMVRIESALEQQDNAIMLTLDRAGYTAGRVNDAIHLVYNHGHRVVQPPPPPDGR